MSFEECAERQSEEAEVLRSIYGEENITFQLGHTTLNGTVYPTEYRIKVPDPNGDSHYAYCPLYVVIKVSQNYPADPSALLDCKFEYSLITNPAAPRLYLLSNWLGAAQKVRALASLHEIYSKQQCESLFDFIETLREFIIFPSVSNNLIDETTALSSIEEKAEEGKKSANAARQNTELVPKPGNRWEEEWKELGVIIGEPLVDRRSTFRAQAIRVNSAAEVREALRILYLNPRIQDATHNMYAYRIVRQGEPVIADHDDDGEDCAGSRMALLLDRTQAKNVLIVVSRWYGGLKLGPDRFRHINNVSLALLEKHDFVDPNRHDNKAGKGKNKK